MRRLIVLSAYVLFMAVACDEQNTQVDTCGDEVADPGEACDGQDFGGTTCQGLGYNGGQIACTDLCTLDLSGCEAAGYCGNGTVEGPSEDCEPEVSTETCISLGYGGGDLVCQANCHWDTSGCIAPDTCGDGEITGGESCDGTNLDGATCESEGWYGGTLSCRSNCDFDLAGCQAVGKCGDGVIQESHFEECDTETFNHTCSSLGYYGGDITCTDQCTQDLSDCLSSGRCGDGTIQEEHGETCDGTNFNGDTCESLGWYAGELVCNTSCGLDLSDCEDAGRCGDGIVQYSQGEGCDGITIGLTCEDLGHLHGGAPTCDASCVASGDSCHRFIQVAAGEFHVCGLTSEGTLLCWGNNYYGQLGNGTTSSSDVPVPVSGGDSYVEVSAGGYHTCALTSGGTAYCWGQNNNGQLGIGSTSAGENIPTLVSGGIVFGHLSSGSEHNCGITSAGVAYCWGTNSDGRLGIGSTSSVVSVPTPVVGGIPFSSLALGFNHTCGVDTIGRMAWCWGDNVYGQLGDGTTTASATPVLIDGFSFTTLSMGNGFSCGIDIMGIPLCWGTNSAGQLGDGSTMAHSLPEDVLNAGEMTSLSAGSSHVCGVTLATSEIVCWGNNFWGQLGTGTTETALSSVSTGFPAPAAKAATGFSLTCVLDTLGNIRCSGENSDGQLGDGTHGDSNTPVRVSAW